MILVEQSEKLEVVDDNLKKQELEELLKVSDMKEGDLYLARHKMHPMYGRPRMTIQDVLDYIKEMNWKPEDMIIELANFPYDSDNKKITNN